MNIKEIVESPRWKAFMAYVYGWGAMLVLVGALFKLQHWPYAGVMLTVGMVTEAFIFFISVFEPPIETPHWEKVYPELREDYDLLNEDVEEMQVKRGGSVQGVVGVDIFEGTSVTPELLDKVSKSLQDLSNTASSLSDISTATVATDMYVKNLSEASESMNTLAQVNNQANEKLTESIDTLVNSYATASDSVSNAGNEFGQKMTESGDRLNSELNKSSDVLASSYSQLSSNIENSLKSLEGNTGNYETELAELNKNLAQLNSAYKSQLSTTKTQGEANEQYLSDLSSLHVALSASVQQMQKYEEQSRRLNENLEALNGVYGNVLGAMNYKK